ncbi:MAG: GumC family protein [Actinomycetota bacterium]
MDEGRREQSEQGLFAAAWRYRWLVLGVTALAVVLALAFNFVQPREPRHAASATLVIQEPITAATVEQQGFSGAYIRSQLEILRSPIVAENAREIVNDDNPRLLTPDEDLPNTTIIGSDSSYLVNVDVVASSPELAVAYANAIAEAYREVSQRQATSTSEAQLAHIDAQIDSINERLNEIERQVSQFIASDEDLSELQTQADNATQEIARLQDRLLTESLSEGEAAAVRRQIQDHRDVMAVYDQILNATASSPERRALEEEQARQVERRARLLTLRDEIAVNMGMDPDAIALVQPAVSAEELPGNEALILGIALLVGAASGLGIAYLLSASRRAIASRSEPASVLGAPLLADVPDFEQERLASPVPVRDNPRSASAEAFRIAFATLEVAMRGYSARSIFVASSTLGRGKTTTVVNTAVAAAVSSRKVLVLDCDFGNQQATRLLAGDDHGSLLGVTDVIEGDVLARDATHEIDLGRGVSLHLMSRGTRPSLAATTLQSEDGRKLVALLASTYDLVIIDGPPMLQVAYASSLAELADGILVVTEHQGRHSELVELKSRLDLVGTPVLGYIYNRSPLRREMTMTEGSMTDILGAGALLERSRAWGRQADTD